MDVLYDANERMGRRYELRSQGYTIEKLEDRVLGIYRIDRDELYSKSSKEFDQMQGVYFAIGR
jgi:hypothetical protein